MYGLNNNTGLKYTDNKIINRSINSTEIGEKVKKISNTFKNIKNNIEQIKSGQNGFQRAKGIGSLISTINNLFK